MATRQSCRQAARLHKRLALSPPSPGRAWRRGLRSRLDWALGQSVAAEQAKADLLQQHVLALCRANGSHQ